MKPDEDAMPTRDEQGATLDHCFVLLPAETDADALAARLERATRALLDAGLRQGSSNTHPGQGTANRRFFFGNVMFELLHFTDVEAATRAPASLLRLTERAARAEATRATVATANACPFGIAFRPATRANEPAHFTHTAYRPDYLPAPLAIHVATNTPPSEPLWFHLPFATPGERRHDQPHREPEPSDHPAGLDTLTRLRITMPAPPGDISRTIATGHPIEWAIGERYWMTLCFDDERRSRVVDRIGDLPVSLRF